MLKVLNILKCRLFFSLLIFCFLFFFIKGTQAQTVHLNKEISIIVDSVSLDNVLDNIAQQCSCYFTYNSQIIDGSKKISLNLKNTPLSSVLDTIIGKDQIVYSEYLNQVIISSEQQVSSLLANKQTEVNLIISGTITDIQTKIPLPFASIAIQSTYMGTICNELGRFSIKIPNNVINDTLLISYVGYYTQKFPIKEISGELEIELLQGVVSIQEIVVRSVDPSYIIFKVRENLTDNYQIEPFNYEAFYREAVVKEKDYSLYTEAILQGYKPKLNHVFASDKIQVMHSRKFSNIKNSDTVAIKIRGGVESCFGLDIIDDFPGFLLDEGKESYNYALADILIWENALVYCVEFKQKHCIKGALPEGVIYVSLNDFAVVGAEFGYSEEKLRKSNRMFIVKKSRAIKTKPKGSKYIVRYKKVNGKYYLNHVRGELFINVKRKGKLFSNDYTTLIEMVITNINNSNVEKKFGKNLLLKTNTIFSDSEFIYEQNYWGLKNTIEPELNILKAFKKAGLKITESNVIY